MMMMMMKQPRHMKAIPLTDGNLPSAETAVYCESDFFYRVVGLILNIHVGTLA